LSVIALDALFGEFPVNVATVPCQIVRTQILRDMFVPRNAGRLQDKHKTCCELVR
jgi:hypothetical protein